MPSHRRRFGEATAEEASAVYDPEYGQMPIPATQFAGSVAALHSLDKQPSVATSASNASVVDRHNMRNGIAYTAGDQAILPGTPQMYDSPYSSKFQPWYVGPIVNYILNGSLYRAGYPAATISYGTMRNLALSERTPQLPTRTSGGPGPSQMGAAPRFKRVQQVPRYSTMPPTYPTASSNT